MVEVHGTNLAGCLWRDVYGGIFCYIFSRSVYSAAREIERRFECLCIVALCIKLHTNSTTMADPRFDVLAAFDDAKAIFFYKTMTTSMISDRSKNVMALELPSSFANEHGKEMSQDVALVRPTCGRAVWWLRFEVRHSSNFPSRVYTFGGGWRDFVLDNGINIGEFLVFELVDRSRLVVHVYPRDDKFGFNARGFCRSGGDEYDPGSGNLDEDRGQSCLTRPSSLPVKVALECEFKKTICSSHTAGKRGSKLNIPARFWRSHGCDKFDKKEYTLEGPRMKGLVKANLLRTERQTKCVFVGGWKAFYIANKLKIGDTVVFTLTGEYQFAVSVAA